MPISHGPDGSPPDDWLTPRRFAFLLLALVVVAFPQVVFGLQTFVYRDFGLFSYPLAFHLRECFWRGELPLWNPLNCCGAPFLAQWNTQVLYPPALFYLLLPLSWSLGVFCLLHLVWGGLGMFLLAERWTGSRLAAAFAGIVFAFSGLMLSSVIWTATVAGFAWIPWVVWLVERAWREGGRAVPLAALAGAMQMLSGGVEAVLLAWTLLGTWWLADFVGGESPRGKTAARAGLVVLLIAGLAAAQLLPFFELLDHSRRQQEISSEMWPMPRSGWANFLAPLFQCRSYQGIFMQPGQFWVNSYYVGVTTVALAIAALWLARRRREVWLMAGLALFCLVLALGDGTPVYGWLTRHFNVVSLMRFPIKFVILPGFVLPLLAAFALSKALAPGKSAGSLLPLGGPWLASVAATLGLTLWSCHHAPDANDRQTILANGIMRAVYATALAALWFGRKKFPPAGARVWQLLFLLLAWLDVFHQMPWPNTMSRAMYEPGLPRHWTPPQAGAARVKVRSDVSDVLNHNTLADAGADYMSRRFCLVADCNLLDDIPTCDGFYPLYLSPYAALLYNVYHDDHPAEPLLDLLGVSQILGLDNDRFDWQPRTTFLPLLTAGQQPLFADNLGALQLLTNADFNPRLQVVLPTEAKPFITASKACAAQLSHVTCSDHQIEGRLAAPTPTLVSAAQTYYPEWRAYVDGQPARLWPGDYAFQSFEVPAGDHEIRLVYEDRRFQSGAAISLASLGVCSLLWAAGRKHRPAGAG